MYFVFVKLSFILGDPSILYMEAEGIVVISSIFIVLGLFFVGLGVLLLVFYRRATRNLIHMESKESPSQIESGSRHYNRVLFSVVFSGTVIVIIGTTMLFGVLSGRVH